MRGSSERGRVSAWGTGRDRDVTGVEIDWRGRTPLAGVTRWRCLERVHGVTAERTQFWPVIAFVHAGAYEVHGPRGRGLVDALHVAFFRPGEPYQTAHPCGLGDEGSALVLREDLFADLLAARLPEAADDPRRLDAAGPCPTPALRRHLSLLRALDAGPVDDGAVEETAIGVADALLAAVAGRRRATPAEARRAHRDLAGATKELLGREFRRPLRLESMAARLGVTPAHLCRVFRRITGSSIHAYVTRLRLRAALEPLAAGARDLSGLALDLGFSSHSHFTAAFRREFGIPPSACRVPARAGF
jgi:AraC family transcriptional regulator